MADQTVTLVLDAEDYYRGIRKITGETDKFKGSADRTGASVDGLRLKTEGRVAANVGAIARSFASGGSAADIFAEAVTRVGESFRGSLLFAGAAAFGIGLYEAITKPIEAIIKLKSEVATLTRSQGTSDFLGTDQINANLAGIGDKMSEIFQRQAERAQKSGLGSAFFNPLFFITQKAAVADQEALNKIQIKAGNDINDLAEKTEKLNKVEQDRSDGLKLRADLEENEIKRLERLGAIARTAQLAGVSGKPASQAADASFNITAFAALRNAALAGNAPSNSIGAIKQDFFNQLVRPFNAGPLFESQAQEAERLSRAQAKQGDFVESARLHRLAIDRHEMAQGIQAGRGLLKLDSLKFEGLITIDQYTFEGLKILNGLNIKIQ